MPVIDLLDANGAPAPNNSSKLKRKQKVSHSESHDLCVSKHASIEDKEVEAFKIQLDDMMGEVHSIKDGVSRRSCASSAKMDPVEVAMDKLNKINAELDVHENSFFRATNYITNLNCAKIIIRMNDVSRKNWLLKHI